ncbi:MAG: hypothetical protein ABIV13_04890 [Fimbriimonadales bacterium]
MLSPTQEIAVSTDNEVIDEHASPDRSVIGPYSVEMPEPRD